MAASGNSRRPYKDTQLREPSRARRTANSSRSRSSSSPRSSRKRSKKRRHVLLFVMEILLVLVLIATLYVVFRLDKADTGNKESIVRAAVNDEAGEREEKADNAYSADKAEDIQVVEEKGNYTNIALFGVDSRNGNLDKGARTDTIIIASLDNDTGVVKLCSIFRDTYLNIGNNTYNKANSAYALGGPDQAIKMLNTNLDLNIDEYVTVDFDALVDTINDLGGVQIDVTEEEISFLNDYQIGTAEETGDKIIDVTSPGMQTLNGLQAVSYCRIRYTKGDDFKRAERQRSVLTQVAEKARAADVSTLNEIIDDILPKVKTSFSKAELVEYAARAATFSIGEQSGFPFERITGTMGRAGSCVVAENFENNVLEFHGFLFGDSTYSPSEVVKEISAKIAADKAKQGL